VRVLAWLSPKRWFGRAALVGLVLLVITLLLTRQTRADAGWRVDWETSSGKPVSEKFRSAWFPASVDGAKGQNRRGFTKRVTSAVLADDREVQSGQIYCRGFEGEVWTQIGEWTPVPPANAASLLDRYTKTFVRPSGDLDDGFSTKLMTESVDAHTQRIILTKREGTGFTRHTYLVRDDGGPAVVTPLRVEWATDKSFGLAGAGVWLVVLALPCAGSALVLLADGVVWVYRQKVAA
jgi:hypothetical protein